MATKYWVGGSGTWNASTTTNWSDTDGGAGGAVAPTSADDVIFNANSDAGTGFTVTINTGAVCQDITVSGLDQTMTLAGSAAWSIFGSLAYPASNLTRTYTGNITFAATTTGKTITTNGVQVTTGSVIFNGSGGSWALGSAFTKTGIITQTLGDVDLNGYSMTCTGAYTLTAGNLNLNNQTLTASTFASSNTNTRAIQFGTGKILLTGNNTIIFNMATVTNFSYTGTPTVELNYSGSVGTRTVNVSFAEAQALDFIVSAGSDALVGFTNIRGINLTGFSGSLTNELRNIYGDVTFSLNATLTAGASNLRFAATTGNQTYTGNGQVLDFPVTKFAAGNLILADDLLQNASRTFTHTLGTIDLNGNTLSTGGWSSSNNNIRSISFAGGQIDVAGGWTVSGTNFTTTGSGVISMNSASSKTFAGGGNSYTCILNQGGAGNLSITGANAFADITNTVQPATVTLPANTTTNLQQFSLQGTAGNLISLRSSIAGQQATINIV